MLATSKKLIWACLMGFVSSACTKPGPLGEFTVSEVAGIPRDLEYVTVEFSVPESAQARANFSIREKDGNDFVPVPAKVVGQGGKGDRRFSLLCPVSADANEVKSYEIWPESTGTWAGDSLVVEGKELELKLQNSFFQADLTSRKANSRNGLGPGQLNGLILKMFGGQLLERHHINMHWAPNFQQEGMDYKTFGHMVDNRVQVDQDPYRLRVSRRGHVPGYEPIQVSVEYQFFAGLPYFLFRSEMVFEDSLDLVLLRNDEMTMDSLFTHVVYSGPEGQAITVPLYDGFSLDTLAKDPVPDDVDWLYFHNDSLGYSYGSIRLEYNNTNLEGGQSPTYGEHTKITKSANSGRYWNRRLINDHLTHVPAGSRYSERNAYLVFQSDLDNPGSLIETVSQKLRNPLQVSTK